MKTNFPLSTLVLLTFLLAACRPAELPASPTTAPTAAPQTTATQPPPSETPRSASEAPPTETAAPTEVPTETPELTATHNLLPVLDPEYELTFGDLANVGSELHDVILFSSLSSTPFQGQEIVSFVSSDAAPRLWAVSPDGQRAGRLTYEETTGTIYFPDDPSLKPVVAMVLFGLNNDRVREVHLPLICAGELDEGDSDYEGVLWPCTDYKFSPDGRFVAFFSGPEICGHRINVVDTETSERIFKTEAGIGHNFEFSADGKLVIASGHCEGGTATLFDPATGEAQYLGDEGGYVWNTGKTALAAQTYPYHGWGAGIWGYNTQSGSLFLNTDTQTSESDHPTWTPDESQLLYQQRPKTPSGSLDYTFEARQIHIVDAATGAIRTLAADSAYDYHLCAASRFEPCAWRGDWVMVRRLPFRYAGVVFSYLHEDVPPCFDSGSDCADPDELLGLNWQTGELVPWDSLPESAPTPGPTATPIPGPDLSRAPVYADPDGNYAFYVGEDPLAFEANFRKIYTLWFVPAEGEPVLWVKDGENFIYLP